MMFFRLSSDFCVRSSRQFVRRSARFSSLQEQAENFKKYRLSILCTKRLVLQYHDFSNCLGLESESFCSQIEKF